VGRSIPEFKSLQKLFRDRDDYLPKRINEHQKIADDLIKTAKGLGKR
jgi:hypothetical protein